MRHVIRKAISVFPFWDYGLPIDPHAEHVDWMDDLAQEITKVVVEYQDDSEE